MIQTLRSLHGACVAPHHLAAQAGRDVLKDGGNAIEATVAMAAAIAVVYPHMNSLGGDGFWLIKESGKAPVAIDASGPAVQAANINFYKSKGFNEIPSRGPLAALTVAGTVSGWQRALEISAQSGGSLPLSRLLSPAAELARSGIVVTQSQAALTAEKLPELASAPGFSATYLVDGKAPIEGSVMRQPMLANTLDQLILAGLDDFYRGEIAQSLARDLAAVESPVSARDLADYQAQISEPLALTISQGTAYNLAPPTQGLASLLILGQFDRLKVTEGESFAHIHGLIEATKQAFLVRDWVCFDPARTGVSARDYLKGEAVDNMTSRIHLDQALPWPNEGDPGDTVWLGCVDAQGTAVSFIQSVYWEFGSGLTLPGTGLIWQNRGISFSLNPNHRNALQPGRKPFHTLNPALIVFNDGRVMPYGTMGGEGQPQTQAAVFSRYALFNQSLQQAVTAPRWLLGRTWGEESTRLKLENRFPSSLIDQLRDAGHDPVVLNTGFHNQMGHAGALVRHPNGVIEGAADPRSDGAVAML
jgi:gamma-glutamyltranspeptidase/glutathione hydrolase